ncbi:BMP family lipoprotein [Metabacillus niabensis]|uniref:Basic membrane protein A n=1 Tax=Metabacillus niabensis TaxID=324854 RepID=A0ABT9YW20_9BACI|nr:BMP family ABC transporter substrate-binding protein [Metabacillus niabensis]MDQ0224191.1 basic membrane protein A [Metabacillus niabensis]
MNRKRIILLLLCLILSVTGCSQQKPKTKVDDRIKIGIMLSDVGLGDQSFSDTAFNGLVKARDELGVLFDYRELNDTGTYEEGLKQLVNEGNDIVIGLGFNIQQDLEKVAKQFPEQQFVIVDAISELENVTSVTFKEDQGSYLVGIVAALTTKTNKIGFIGGEDTPLINKFESGFIEGIRAVNNHITVVSEYANDFGNEQLGAEIAKKMIDNNVDVIYGVAGLTGVGMLKEAQRSKVYGIGVDTDQYFYAEEAVVTSMLKNIDVAMYQLAEQLVKQGKISKGHIELGLKENGVDLAPLRVVNYSKEQTKLIENYKEQLANQQ